MNRLAKVHIRHVGWLETLCGSTLLGNAGMKLVLADGKRKATCKRCIKVMEGKSQKEIATVNGVR